MQIQSVIQSSAKIIKVTELKVGNVVKYIDENYSTPELKYGIVTDILNSGEKAYVEMLLYTKSYNDVKAEYKLISGTDEVSIFPAKKETVAEYLNSAIERLRANIEQEKKKLNDNVLGLEKAEKFANGELEKELTTPKFEQIDK